MNENFNKNAKVEKFTTMVGIAVRLIVIEFSPRLVSVHTIKNALKGEFYLGKHEIFAMPQQRVRLAHIRKEK